MKPYYQDESVTIYNGDCREVVPEIEYDSVVTDPPYGKNLNYGEESTDTKDWFIEHAKWLVGLESPLIFTCPSSRLYEIPKPDWIGVWHKPMSFGFWNTPILPHWEAMCIYNQPEKISRSDVFVSNPAKPIVKGHPAPKPLPLWREVMVAFGDGVVLDPFLGSGTTLRAAKDLGVKAVGIEINERYCEIAAQRMSQLAMEL